VLARRMSQVVEAVLVSAPYGSETDQFTVTSLTCQPFRPAVPESE